MLSLDLPFDKLEIMKTKAWFYIIDLANFGRAPLRRDVIANPALTNWHTSIW